MTANPKILEYINELAKAHPFEAEEMFKLYVSGCTTGHADSTSEYVTSGLSGTAASGPESYSTIKPVTDVLEERIGSTAHEVEVLKADSYRHNVEIDACRKKIGSLINHLDELTDIARAFVLLKKDSLEATAALMTVLEGYLDEDIVNEKDIMEKLYERIKEIKKTPMFKEMKHRIAEYKEERDGD